jgi:hypothetical protein
MKRTKSRKRTKPSRAPTSRPSSVPMVRAQLAQPTFRSSLPYFIALIGIAIAWYYASLLIILIAIIVGPFVLLAWLEPRYPRTAFILYSFLSGFISGLFGSRYYYRRRW